MFTHIFSLLVASSSSGVVQVYLLNSFGEKMSNTVSFEYITPSKAKEDFVENDINDMDDLQEMLHLLSIKTSKMKLNSKETKGTKETNRPGKHDKIVLLIRGKSLEKSRVRLVAPFLNNRTEVIIIKRRPNNKLDRREEKKKTASIDPLLFSHESRSQPRQPIQKRLPANHKSFY